MKEHKLHVILHIGSSKTGSTALQAACRKHADALLAAGVLYPEVRSHAISHHFLGLLVKQPGEQARIYGQAYVGHPELLQADFAAHWRSIKRQVQRHKPRVLLLSSETLFVVPEPEKAAALRQLFLELAGSWEVVAYIRRPSAFYLSRVQQDLKHSGHFSPPDAIAFRDVVESWQQLLGAPVKLAAFARESLHDGDIFRDFLSRYLPQVRLAEDLRAGTANETLSAESMALMQDYYNCNHPGKERWIVEDSRRYRALLQKTERLEGGGRRPELRADIAAHVDRSSVDLHWLDAQYGIRFSGVDLASIGSGNADMYLRISRVAELCEVDQARKERLMLMMLRLLLTPRLKLPVFIVNWLSRHQNWLWLRGIKQVVRPLRKKLNAWL